MSHNRQWYTFKNEVNQTPELFIFDDIDDRYVVSAQSVVDQIRNLDATDINVRLNSRGGMVFEGIAIYNALRLYKANIHVTIEGLAASLGVALAEAFSQGTLSAEEYYDATEASCRKLAELKAEAEITSALRISEQIYNERRRQANNERTQALRESQGSSNVPAQRTASQSPQRTIRLEYPGGDVNVCVAPGDETKLLDARIIGSLPLSLIGQTGLPLRHNSLCRLPIQRTVTNTCLPFDC